MKRLQNILWIFLVCTGVPVNAQLPDVSFRYLDYRDGLPEYAESTGILQDYQGRIWLGYNKGLFRYDGYEVINFPPNIQDSTALTEQIVHALYLHNDSTIWVGTRNMGFCIYDPRKDAFQRILPEEEGGTFPLRRVWDFHRDNDGTIWIACLGGLVKCSPDSMTFTRHSYYTAEMTVRDTQYFNTLREIESDPQDPNTLWIGSRSGVLTFDKSNETFTWEQMPYSSSEVGLESRDYLAIHLEWASPEDLWISTWAGGIVHHNRQTGTWERYRSPHIRPVDDIGFIFKRKDANAFWYGTRFGFGVFNHRTGGYSYFKTDRDHRGGIKWSQSYHNCLITHDSILFVVGSLGLSISTEVMQNSFIGGEATTPVPIITAIAKDQKPLQEDVSNTHIDEIIIDEKGRSVSFTCTWPVFQDPQNVQYRFKLEGHDDDWVNYGTSRKVQYTNLRPGRYQFRYAATRGGDWVEGLTSPEVRVLRPFWQSPLFLGGIGIIFLGILGIIYNMRIRHIRKEAELKSSFNRQLAENEMTALRAQMNPHFMFNSLNSIKNYILKENTEKASRYLTKFSQLMRAILKNSQSKLVSLEDELHALQLYIEMEAMRFSETFEYHFHIDESLDPARLYIPPLLIQPYVENAIWHGLMLKEGKRELNLNIKPQNGHLHIIVEDNGIGREKANELKAGETRKKRSYGMRITENRVDLINRTLGIDAKMKVEDLKGENGKAAGTRVNIIVPQIHEDRYAGSWD